MSAIIRSNILSRTLVNGLLNRSIARKAHNGFFLSTVNYIPGYRVVDSFGLVTGSIVRSNNILKDMYSKLQAMMGGELEMYTDMGQKAREEALNRMKLQAEAAGANGVIGIKFETSTASETAVEVLAYGTAVLVEKIVHEKNL